MIDLVIEKLVEIVRIVLRFYPIAYFFPDGVHGLTAVGIMYLVLGFLALAIVGKIVFWILRKVFPQLKFLWKLCGILFGLYILIGILATLASVLFGIIYGNALFS